MRKTERGKVNTRFRAPLKVRSLHLAHSKAIKLIVSTVHDWVATQSMERRKRELEADEREYEERLANARKKEQLLKKLAKGRVTKRQVRGLIISRRI